MPDLRRKPVVIIIRDGWGENPYEEWNHANAVHLGKTPVADALMKDYPNVLIHTSGEDVGLPDGVMGNSEVGHQNIGAGRIVDQEVMRITRSIRDGSFFDNEVLTGAIEHIRTTGGKLHVLGLMSDGRVHSDIQHSFAVVDLFKRSGLEADRLLVHAITDGRDTSPTGGKEYIRQIEENWQSREVGRIGSVIVDFMRWTETPMGKSGIRISNADPREPQRNTKRHPTPFRSTMTTRPKRAGEATSL